MREFVAFEHVDAAYFAGFGLARWLTDPQEWTYYHMVYCCPTTSAETQIILVHGVEILAAKIESIIVNETEQPVYNEWLQSKIDTANRQKNGKS